MNETQAKNQIPLEMLTEGQAAAYLGLSPKTLPSWRCTKRVALPYVKIGAAIRYRKADLDKFIELSTVAA